MRLAYADPPYIGQAVRHYRDHPDFAGEVDHAKLIESLVATYDGWALSASSNSLRYLLPLCPAKVRVAAWCKTWAANRPRTGSRYSWEPVIFWMARRSFRAVTNDSMTLAPQMGSALVGQKPPEVCRWVFHLLGAEPGDTLDDLFPGSGAVGRAWEKFQSQAAMIFEERYCEIAVQRLAQGVLPLEASG